MNSVRTVFMGARPFFLYALTGLFLTGCSSIYTVKNFSSKENFYKDFNKSANGNSFKIILTDGRTFKIQKGAYITNDSLFFVAQLKKEMIKINPNEIKEIKYYGNYKSGYSNHIILKNGEELNSDSTYLNSKILYVYVSKPVQGSLPLDKIKEASYKNIIQGIIPGFIAGTFTGFLLGLSTIFLFSGNNQYSANNTFDVAFAMFSASMITGIVWGWISGYNCVYRFNE